MELKVPEGEMQKRKSLIAQTHCMIEFILCKVPKQEQHEVPGLDNY